MMNGISAAPRVLFVVDNDYGALGTMMYFVHGQRLAARALMLLPRRVHELHGASLGVASRPYESLDDVLAAVDAERPDLVLLASGYLFASQRLLGLDDVRALVRGLEERRCRVATTDPYLGTYRELPAAVAASSGARGIAARIATYVRVKRLERHVRRVAAAVEGLPKFYPVPMPPARSPRFSFFNPRYIRDEAELTDISGKVSALPGMRAGEPRWLFVLATFDLTLQERRFGPSGFADRVAARLRDAVDQGRHPTFVGPAAFVEELSRRFAGDARVSLMAGCAFDSFERLLLDAEAAFYWQLFSTSAFLRLWNGLPTFFFDEGHNARLLAPMRAAGLEHYFMGESPVYADVDARLDAQALAARRDHFRLAARATCERLAALPGPEEMVEAMRRA